MIEFQQYAGRFNGVRGQLSGLPDWARLIVAIVALPGILIGVASLIGFLLALAVLAILTVPVYSILKRLTDRPRTSSNGATVIRAVVGGGDSPFGAGGGVSGGVVSSPGVKRVESTIVE